MSADKKDSSRKNLFRDIFENRKLVGSFETTQRKLSRQEIQQETDKLLNKIKEDEFPGYSTAPPNNVPWYRIAAAIAFLIVATSIYLYTSNRSQTIDYKTTYGETRQIVLPDSSIINLNANSTLTYYPKWEEDQIREVWLSGEAFFDVQKKPQANHPKFVVHTSDLDVEVLGTRFNVQNRHDKTQVVLSSGKVKLNIAEYQQELLMEPGEMVAYSDEKHAYEKKQVQTENYTSWKDNFLIFENSTLAEIANVLEDSYGLHIRFEGPGIETNRFTATVPANKIDVLFPMLEESFKLEITKKENDIMIQKKD